jgi:hypothetical protein
VLGSGAGVVPPEDEKVRVPLSVRLVAKRGSPTPIVPAVDSLSPVVTSVMEMEKSASPGPSTPGNNVLFQVYGSLGLSPAASPRITAMLATPLSHVSKMLGDGNDTSPAVGVDAQLPVHVNVGVKVSAWTEETPMVRMSPTARIQNVLRMFRTPSQDVWQGNIPWTHVQSIGQAGEASSSGESTLRTPFSGR